VQDRDVAPQREPLMSSAELAAYLGGEITVSALAAWRSRGTGPDWIKVGHGVRYRPAAVEAWLKACERAGKKAS